MRVNIMDCTILMKIIFVKAITKDSPLWSHYLARYIDSGYLAEFECEGAADKWGIYDEWDICESIADYFDVVGDFDCDVRRAGRKIQMKGTCVFPLGEPVKGTHNIPFWIDVE